MKFRFALVPALALIGAMTAGAAQARDADVSWSVTVGTPVYTQPAPVVRAPLLPAYHPHAVRYQAPTHWDRDGDGIPNRYDRRYNPVWDRDGDGIPNRHDRRHNPAWDRDGDGVPNRYDRNDRMTTGRELTTTATACPTATTATTTTRGAAERGWRAAQNAQGPRGNRPLRRPARGRSEAAGDPRGGWPCGTPAAGGFIHPARGRSEAAGDPRGGWPVVLLRPGASFPQPKLSFCAITSSFQRLASTPMKLSNSAGVEPIHSSPCCASWLFTAD